MARSEEKRNTGVDFGWVRARVRGRGELMSDPASARHGSVIVHGLRTTPRACTTFLPLRRMDSLYAISKGM
jgi:hypothetical protein